MESREATATASSKPVDAMLIVDDHALLRTGLKYVCDTMGVGVSEYLEAETLSQGLSMYEKHRERIALVVLDLHLPDAKGLLVLQLFKQRFPDARLLALSGSADHSIAAEARVFGAEQFVFKGASLGAVAKAIQGRLEATQPLPRDGSNPSAKSHVAAITDRIRLSEREIQILNFVVEGRTNQEIVERTQLKIGTVKNYVSGLFAVFGVESRTKLVSLFH
jgi:DNA-binding NarL/FixJ family response regulator